MLNILRFFDLEKGVAREKILVGIDPNDHSKPAVAYDLRGNRITENISPVIAGEYMSQDGKRAATRYRKAAKGFADEAAELGRKASAAMIAKGNAAYANRTPKSAAPSDSKVVEPRFNRPFKVRVTAPEQRENPIHSDILDQFFGMAKASSN